MALPRLRVSFGAMLLCNLLATYLGMTDKSGWVTFGSAFMNTATKLRVAEYVVSQYKTQLFCLFGSPRAVTSPIWAFRVEISWGLQNCVAIRMLDTCYRKTVVDMVSVSKQL